MKRPEAWSLGPSLLAGSRGRLRLRLHTVVASSVTAVCASARPVIEAPVLKTIAVCDRMMPLNADVVPSVASPATCQKTLRACAPAGQRDGRAVAHREVLCDLEDPDRVRAARKGDAVANDTPVPHL